MYQLKFNSTVIGTFKTLKAARAYQPDMATILKANIGSYYLRVISKVKGK
jgi:hypothetical protein